MLLNEVTRSQLIAQSKSKERYDRKKRSSIITTMNEYNKIDMNKLFKDDILECNVPVKGETNNYVVTISFANLIDFLKSEIKLNNNILNLRCCVQALQKTFNKEDIYVHCSCLDFKFRFGYWSTIKQYEAKIPELRPAKITNPSNDKGIGCKHVLLVLSRTLWILKVASVLNNYIKYMERNQKRLYDKLIFPKLFEISEEEKSSEGVQLSFDNLDNEEK